LPYQARKRHRLESFLGKIGRHADNLRAGVLTIAGFGCITAAAFQLPNVWGTVAGWATAGASLLVIEGLSHKEPRR
jgi:hypothetical protein